MKKRLPTSYIQIAIKKTITLSLVLIIASALLTGCKLKSNKIIDYSKTSKEISKYYSESGLNSIKSTFIEEEAIDLALLNLGKIPMNIKAKTYDGKEFELSSLKGKKIMLDIVRTDCPVCQAEIPVIDKIIEENTDIVVVSVFYKNTIDEINEYYKNANSTTDKLILTSEGFEAKSFIDYYNLKAVPSIILIDEDFKVSYIYSGEISNKDFNLVKEIAFKKGLYKNLK